MTSTKRNKVILAILEKSKTTTAEGNFTHRHMETTQLYFMKGLRLSEFNEAWDEGLQNLDFLPPIAHHPKKVGVWKDVTFFLDIDGYPSKKDLRAVEKECIHLAKTFFILPDGAKVKIFRHINNCNKNKVHLFLTVNGKPFTCSFTFLKEIWKILRAGGEGGSTRTWIDSSISSLRLPGASKPNDESQSKGTYPYIDGWDRYTTFHERNKKYEVNPKQRTKWEIAKERKSIEKLAVGTHESDVKKEFTPLSEESLELILADETKDFILENIPKIEIDFFVKIALYHLFTLWGMGLTDLGEFLALASKEPGAREDCNGDCVHRIRNALEKANLEIDTSRAYFGLRKRILKADPSQAKKDPVVLGQRFDIDGVSVPLRTITKEMFGRGENGMADIYLKYRKTFLKLTDVKAKGKGIIGFFWDEKTLLWEPINPSSLQRDISEIMMKVAKFVLNQATEELEELEEEKEDENAQRSAAEEANLTVRILNLKSAKTCREKHLKKMMTVTGCSGIYKSVTGERSFIEPEFADTLNTVELLVPLVGRKVIDFSEVGRSKGHIVRERRREDLFSKTIDIREPGDPNHPDVVRFMETFQRDGATRKEIQKIVGEALLGFSTDRTRLSVFIGPASSGKSVFQNILDAVFSSKFFATGNKKLLADGENGRPVDKRREKASLKGKKLACFSELSSDTKLDIALIKSLTGGEKATGCKLFDDETPFPICARIFAMTNDMPYWQKDLALEERLVFIPCDTVFGPGGDFERDNEFVNRCMKESIHHFFAYFIEGAEEFLRAGKIINHTEKMLGEKNVVVETTDPLNFFLSTYCTFGQKHSTFSNDFMERYKEYMNEIDAKPVTMTKMFQTLRRQNNAVASKTKNNKITGKSQRFWEGVSCSYEITSTGPNRGFSRS